MEQNIKGLTEKFVSELVDMVRRDTLAQLALSLGGGAKPSSAPLPPPVNGRRRKFSKRPAEEIERVSKLVIEQLCSKPGQSALSLSRATRVRMTDLRLSTVKLRTAGLIYTRGAKGGMRYYPAERIAKAS